MQTGRRRQGLRALRPRRRAICWPAGRPTPRSEALAALEIAPSFERAQELLLNAIEGSRPMTGEGLAARARAARQRPLRLAACCCVGRRRGGPRSRRPRTPAAPDRAVRRPPMDLRRAFATPPGRCRRAADTPCTTSPGTSTHRPRNRTSHAACGRPPPSRSTIRSCSRSRIRISGTIPGSTSSSRGNLRLKEAEVPILREFLLRGGTLTFDDFHGPIEWANLERELKRVFPGSQDHRSAAGPSDLSLLLRVRQLSANAGAGLVPAGPHVGEGRLRRAPARD